MSASCNEKHFDPEYDGAIDLLGKVRKTDPQHPLWGPKLAHRGFRARPIPEQGHKAA